MEIKRALRNSAIVAMVIAPGLGVDLKTAQASENNNMAMLSAVPPLLPSPEAVALPDSPDLPKFIAAAVKLTDPSDPLKNEGPRLTNVWQTADKKEHVTFQRLDLVMDVQTGEITPDTLLESLHEKGLDRKLASGDLGLVVPEKVDLSDGTSNLDEAIKKREDLLNIPQSYRDSLKDPQLKSILGAPTSPVIDYGSYKIGRFQGGALQEWEAGNKKGEKELILVGEAPIKLNLVPKGAILPQPVVDKEILEVTPAEPTDINAIVAWGAAQMGIPESYARRIVNCESSFNPKITNSSGASGLWQLMPVHAWRFTKHGWNWDTDRFDPYKNTVIAVEVWKDNPNAWQCK